MHYRFVLRHGRRTDDQPGRGERWRGEQRERGRGRDGGGSG